MTSLLDANILIDAAKAELVPRLVAASAFSRWMVTQEVFDELSGVPARSKLTPLLRPSPKLISPEANLCTRIVTGGSWGALGVGEASCIAAAMVDPDFEFVTWDIKAGWRGPHELRGRTSVGHAWLQRLVDLACLTKPEAEKIAAQDSTRRHPTWW